jgi:hypothetical protein
MPRRTLQALCFERKRMGRITGHGFETLGQEFPDVSEQPVRWGTESRRLHWADQHKAIVDMKTEKIFAVVSRDYKLIRHEEAIKEVENAIHQANSLGPYETLTAFYNDGGRMRRTYRFLSVAYEVRPGDFVNPELRVLNSYDLAWPFVVDLGAYRQICSNGLTIGTVLLQLRKRHVSELNRIALQEKVATALDRFRDEVLIWKDWAQRPLTQDTYNRVLEAMDFGTKAKEEIEGRIRSEAEGSDTRGYPRMSLWAFLNVLCWYVTHKTVSLNHRVHMERRLKAAIRYFSRG